MVSLEAVIELVYSSLPYPAVNIAFSFVAVIVVSAAFAMFDADDGRFMKGENRMEDVVDKDENFAICDNS